MYEPIVLQKRKPRSIAGTPASIFCMFGTFGIVSVCCAVSYFVSNIILEKKKLIAEFDERDVNTKQMTVFDEYLKTRTVWQQPELQGAVSIAFRNLWEKSKLNVSAEPSNSDSNISKAND